MHLHKTPSGSSFEFFHKETLQQLLDILHQKEEFCVQLSGVTGCGKTVILIELDPEKTKKIIERLMLIFDIAELKADDLRKAAKMKTADYEDAVQICCAKRINADFIVTRNIRDFASSPVPAVKPSEHLDRI